MRLTCTCAKCQKKGHYAKVCQSKAASKVSAAMHSPVKATTQSSGSLSKSIATINIGLTPAALRVSYTQILSKRLIRLCDQQVVLFPWLLLPYQPMLQGLVRPTLNTKTRNSPTFIFQSLQGSVLTSYWAWISSHSTRTSPFSMEAANPRYLSVALVPSIWIQLSLLLI